MCGISAVLHLPNVGDDHTTRTRSELELQMSKSLDIINHRGPDSRGIWISPANNLVLGHNRLAINDLSSAGSQPFHSPDGTLHAVVNGELYDYEALKEDLKGQNGFHFASDSDSEIVLALYQVHGIDFLQHLRGEFALCIYDERKKLFIAARDRYGIKPLFWTISKGRLLMGAEIKAFLPLEWEAEWDVKSLVEAGWNFDDRTCFKGVRKVRPGCYLTVDEKGEIEEKRCWDLEYPDKMEEDPRSEEELIQGVRERLEEVVRIRLRADVPVGVYLSGGIDSSVIAGITAHLVKEQGKAMGSLDQVSCFSVAFEKTSGFDESDIASRTASHLGIRQHVQVMNEEAFASRFEDATWHCEHHNPDLNYVGKFALSELPRELGFKVVLTGEGADEHFTGYQVFLPDFLREQDLSWKGAMLEADRIQQFEKSETQTQAYYASIGASLKFSPSRRKLNNISTLASMTAFIPDVLDPAFTTNTLDPQDVIAADLPPHVIKNIQEKWHPINAAQYIWTKNHLPNQFMSCLGDRTEMAHSIEGRTPFLDHKLTEYVNQIPPSLKIKYRKGEGEGTFTEKWILREAMRPYITEEIYERAKHPFSAPFTYPAGGPLHELFKRLITEENVRWLGFVDWEEAMTLVGRAFENKEARALRNMIVVAQWIVLSKRFGMKPAESE